MSRIKSRIGKENVNLANALCLLVGGTPFIYYGEEIGMEDLDINSISFEQCQDSFGKIFGVFNFLSIFCTVHFLLIEINL